MRFPICYTELLTPLTRVDHVEGDSVPHIREAVPQVLDEDQGDGELHVRDKERHRDGACPPGLVNIKPIKSRSDYMITYSVTLRVT